MENFSKVKNVRFIAFYLPQFHPIPENDAWWGKGFTEWTNVIKAKPLFRGHYQPHFPANLGFYDLRSPVVRETQAELAKEYDIEGFCYWHYWFNGKRLLERPFNEVLMSGKPNFPFCLAWANESWSRRWLGEEKNVLQKQTYSLEDDFDHIRWLIKPFSDPRYITFKGRPIFLIYRPNDLLNPKRTTDIFRNECIRNGIAEPYLVGINAHCSHIDCRNLGFDGTLNFEPQLGVLPDFMYDRPKISKFFRNSKLGVMSMKLKIYDYGEACLLMRSLRKNHHTYPCIFVAWDNTPRREKNAIIIVDSTPKRFELSLKETVVSVLNKPYDDRLVFINAWNEWAEGNHLEPDHKYGLGFLEVVKRVNSQSVRTRPNPIDQPQDVNRQEEKEHV